MLPKEFLINKGEIVIIIGTPHTGTINRMAKCVGRTGQVVVVEPDQVNLTKHKDFIEVNHIKNVTIVPKAASNKKGIAKFLIAPHPSRHRLYLPNVEHDSDYQSANYYIKTIDVEVDTVDNIMHGLKISEVGYVENMVNGAEMIVLEGMEQTLSKTKRIMVKGHARHKDTKIPLCDEILPFLYERGFKIKRTLPSQTNVKIESWDMRQGDVFAWREK